VYKIVYLAFAVVLLSGCNSSESESNINVSDNIEEDSYEEGRVKADTYYEEYEIQEEDGLITEEFLEEGFEPIEEEFDYEIDYGDDEIGSSEYYDTSTEDSSTQEGSSAGGYYNQEAVQIVTWIMMDHGIINQGEQTGTWIMTTCGIFNLEDQIAI
jgi:hypothetical protein